MSAPRLVATDLDGTLLDSEGRVSARTRAVLDELDAAGVPVVFTTGIADAGDHYIIASGEADLACRMTHVPKARFA